jgi:D-glycero-D-manno-heptose 1,7-bisphosphate phosphatase
VKTRAAFLDRDGVINSRPPEHAYVRHPDQLDLIPGAAEAVQLLREGGFVPVVVSNQRGVARGLVTHATLRAIEEKIRAGGIPIERFYYCPHGRDTGCDCRKPRPGLLLKAAKDLDLELGQSVMIGDAESDISAGRAAGCFTVRVGPSRTETAAEALVETLLEAAILLTAKAPPQAGTAAV